MDDRSRAALAGGIGSPSLGLGRLSPPPDAAQRDRSVAGIARLRTPLQLVSPPGRLGGGQ
ncbi:MAG: hypothetical protein HGA19_20145 [Oscillochloris sp.]|nr:hypothetical protein [Oscillochloris sp.]